MSLNTSLKGRLRNTHLPKTHGLLPLFEAVVNSIHSIDAQRKKEEPNIVTEGEIKIKIIRDGQISNDETKKPEIVGFEISDDGIGFNSDNFISFQTLDSEYKIELGCRGVGRLLWLKAFKRVSVQSVYEEDQEGEVNKLRRFDFNVASDIHNDPLPTITTQERQTTISLLSIDKSYLNYLPKSVERISKDLLDHCLWYFIRDGGAPDISIEDGFEKIKIQNLYDELMIDSSKTDSFSIQSEEFEITHVKLKSSIKNKHSLVFSAANRVVKEESLIGKIPGLFGSLSDGENEFTYTCFLTSKFLTDNVNSERLNFNLMESGTGMFEGEEFTMQNIREKAIEKITNYLDPLLTESKLESERKLASFINEKAPRYKPVLKRLDLKDKYFDPSISDKELELKLHGYLMEFESKLLSEGHDLLIPNGIEDKDDYSKRIEDYLSKASELKQSDLANYVSHRRVILDLLSKAIQRNSDGKYLKEEVLHKLIMPMQKTSDEIRFEDSNLWLVDERLAFHNYFASDKTINSLPVTYSISTKEPDLFALNIFDNPLLVNDSKSLPLASITVIEIKRPMRNDAKAGEEKDPIEQALGYLRRVRTGSVLTSTGRPIPNSENIPGFCYVICDITSTIKDRCDFLDLQITADKMGYFGYHKTYNSYIEVISFDRLVNMARERNKAFFDKLGLPTF
jgi:hypothetical protein